MMSGLGECVRMVSFSAPHDVFSEFMFMCQIFALLVGEVGARPRKLSSVVWMRGRIFFKAVKVISSYCLDCLRLFAARLCFLTCSILRTILSRSFARCPFSPHVSHLFRP